MSFLPRSFIVFAICVPLAILLGIMLAEPLGGGTLLLLGGCFLLLLTPFLLKYYHEALLISWNAFLTVFFLPGRPYLWMLLTAIGFVLMILIRTLNKDSQRNLAPLSVAVPLIFIGLVSYITAQFTGGVGLHSFGSDVYGGKRYFFLWFAIASFFVLTSKAIPPNRLPMVAALYFLSAITACLSNLAYVLGPNFYFMFLLFPSEWGIGQAAGDQIIGGFTRVTGLAPAGTAIASFLLMRHGIKGLLDVSKPWRVLGFLCALILGFLSGFRSVLVVLGLIIIFLIFTERLYKTKYLFILLTGGLLCFALLLPVAKNLPLAMQRVLTVLPIELDAAAEHDAQGTILWRVEMWRLVAAEIPQYFWLGKGYTIDPTDLFLAEESVKRGVRSPYEPALVTGDYHSGPLSLIIPFGIWGVVGFLWFAWACHRVLWQNYRHSPPEMLNLNQFLLACFYARLVFFWLFFGAFYLDLALFVGIVGLSLSANGGVRVPVKTPVPVAEPEQASGEWADAGAGGLVPAFNR